MSLNLENLLNKAFNKRAPLFDTTEAFRIVNGAPDGFPGMTLDKFGDRYQIQFFGDELLREKRAIADRWRTRRWKWWWAVPKIL